MLRQANSRNQKSKGFRVKHVLQILLLLAIAIWLIYQLKHSYDKKMALEARISKLDSQPDLFKLGRKGLLPINGEETDPANATHNKEDESEVVEEEEEPEIKQETVGEEGSGGGDDVIDEIDEQDQERGDEEAERGEEFADEEDKVVLDEAAGISDDQGLGEHQGDSQEAREENYKRDDASSAVRHDTQTAESGFGNGDEKSSGEEQRTENTEEKDVGETGNVVNEAVDGAKENSDDGASAGTVDGSNGNASIADLGENETTQPVTEVEKRELEVGASIASTSSNSSVSEHDGQSELQTNSTSSTESSNEMELQANPSAIVSENPMETQSNLTDGVPPQNGTLGLDAAQDQNATAETGNRGDDEPGLQSDVAMEQAEMSDRSNERPGSDDSLVTAEEREARTDLSTLPSIQNEATNDMDVAAE